MIFYLGPSRQLFVLLSLLYVAMICAVLASNLYLLYKTLIILILLYHGLQSIKKHALRSMPQSPIRICCKDDIWHIENKAGACASGQRNHFVYISRLLIILSISYRQGKGQKSKFILIPPDSLPPLQFRRLSMKIRY